MGVTDGKTDYSPFADCNMYSVLQDKHIQSLDVISTVAHKNDVEPQWANIKTNIEQIKSFFELKLSKV